MKETHTLQRNIGMPQAIALYIGAVLGSGILIVPGLAAEMAGPASPAGLGIHDPADSASGFVDGAPLR